MHAKQGFPVEFHEGALALLVHKAEGVYTESLHHAHAAGNGPVAHQPHDGVHALRHQRNEIPESLVRAGGLRHFVVRLGFHCVDEVGELDGILDEEHGHVVAHQIIDAFIGVKLHGKSAYVPGQVRAAPETRHGADAREHRRAPRRIIKEARLGPLRERFVNLEVAVGA
jgi:hypothetical protein